MQNNNEDKVKRVLDIFKACDIDDWARELKQQYLDKAFYHLEEIAVVSSRKNPLMELANFLVQREH
jgi:geranylgeranyl diphosphate synthase type II